MQTEKVTIDVPVDFTVDIADSKRALDELRTGFLAQVVQFFHVYGLGHASIINSTTEGYGFIMLQYSPVSDGNIYHIGRTIIFYWDGWGIEFENTRLDEPHFRKSWRVLASQILEFAREQVQNSVDRKKALDRFRRCIAILNE